jgi:hypothetical protein
MVVPKACIHLCLVLGPNIQPNASLSVEVSRLINAFFVIAEMFAHPYYEMSSFHPQQQLTP